MLINKLSGTKIGLSIAGIIIIEKPFIMTVNKFLNYLKKKLIIKF